MLSRMEYSKLRSLHHEFTMLIVNEVLCLMVWGIQLSVLSSIRLSVSERCMIFLVDPYMYSSLYSYQHQYESVRPSVISLFQIRERYGSDDLNKGPIKVIPRNSTRVT